MATTSEKREKKSKKKAKNRVERKFLPESSRNRGLVAGLGGVGSAVLGAGMYGQLYAKNFRVTEEQTVNPMMALTIGGAALVMGAVWLGTSADAAVRVGSPGVGLDKNGDIKRIPWYALTRIEWDESDLALRLEGKDESGASTTIHVSARTQATACAWIVKEAHLRAGELAKNLPEDLAERLPEASADAGEKAELEPVHVVGRRCAISDEIIAYEPDAVVCTRCERVYEKEHVPGECACGEWLSGDKPASSEPEEARAAS